MLTKFSELKLTFQSKEEIIKRSAITAAAIVLIGLVLFGIDSGVTAAISAVFG